jgi:uncharacterized membrane protein
LVRAVTDRRPSPVVRRRAWQVLAVLGAALVLVVLWWGQRWQQQVHVLVGLEPPPAYQAIGIVAVALLVFVWLVAIGRLLRRLTRWVIRALGRILPRRLVRPLAVVAVGAPFATGVPAGHGHHYVADYVDGWARVAQPPAWTAADTERLRQQMGAL